jgi:hypothetical protein
MVSIGDIEQVASVDIPNRRHHDPRLELHRVVGGRPVPIRKRDVHGSRTAEQAPFLRTAPKSKAAEVAEHTISASRAPSIVHGGADRGLLDRFLTNGAQKCSPA